MFLSGWKIYRVKNKVNSNMASGTLRLGRFIVTDESFSLNELVDVTTETPSSGDTIVYKDNAVDAGFTTGWHASPLTTNDLSDAQTTTAIQNDLLAFNESAADPTFGDGWFSKNVGSIFSDLDATVNSIVGLNTAKIQAEAGNPAKTDMVLTTAVAAVGGITCSVGSNGANNILFKKEPSEGSFTFVRVLGKGEAVDLSYPIGTALRSTKGIYGFSGPHPTGLGSQSFALTQNQFYVSSAATVHVVSLGTEVTLSLLSADRSTTLSGPTVVAAYETATFVCPATGEYFLTSSGPVCASVNEGGNNVRPLLPMTTELMSWNTGCLVSALESATTVTYFRRNGTTGTLSVSPGTAAALGAGADSALSPNGCVRVTADKPISIFTGTDGIGSQAISGCPVSQLAQVFSHPSFISSSTSYAQAGIAVASLYEGTATVYSSTGVVVDTFDYVRSVAVTTAADQVYPAAGRWKPSDVSTVTVLDGGWVETSTPAMAIFNTNGSFRWGNSGKEYMVIGTTPDEIRADIKRDGNGISRRRDIDNSGAVTWAVC